MSNAINADVLYDSCKEKERMSMKRREDEREELNANIC